MIQKMRSEDFDKVYSIMEESFPIDEYRTYDEQKELLENPRYSIYVLMDSENSDADDMKAFITVYRFEDFAFVEHFAVNPAFRNKGLGAVILKEIKELLSCRICLEVELPDSDFARRRIGFYERNGFFVNDYPYIQPPISQGRQAIPLIVMTTHGAVTEEEFNVMKTTLYREVYHAL